MPNRLINETSPYLLQHVDNPVDWYPWGEEAMKLARETDRPILLSVGYAACHWCHVMAHESFEDEETAEFMNQHFVNIKVDREERPDLDSIYMNAVQAMTGQGGWPMTVALTPDGRPFFGGTYYPPQPRMGMPSFRQVLASITNAWKTQRHEIDQSADKLTEHLGRSLQLAGQQSSIAPETVSRAVSKLSETFDQERGGFGGAPKFPQPMIIEFLLHAHHQNGDSESLQMAEVTLAMMANGGIYDHLGGGFARYSTDENWLVPHFEKMLYDNALLARVYLHGWQVTGHPLFRRVVEETLDFMAAEMMHEEGGFFSSYDADSEGVEGKFYVWSTDEIRKVLGDDAEVFMLFFDVSDRGNWEGSNILNAPRDYEQVASLLNMPVEELQSRLDVARKRLLDVRGERVAPGLDDKVLTSWNGLALAAFAEAGRILDRPDYRDIAIQNATFLYDTVRAADGRLLRTWKDGSTAKFNAYLEDYAFLSDGLLALYQSTFEEKWFIWAKELCDLILAHFTDHENGGFFDTSDDHEPLIKRPKELQDNAIPSGNAMAAKALLKMSLFTGEMHYWDIAEKMIASMDQVCAEYPAAFAVWLEAAAFIMGEPKEVAIVGESGASDTNALLKTLFSRYAPNLVIATGDSSSSVPLLSNREAIDGRATAYVCQRFVCKRPLIEPDELLAQLSPGS